MSQQLDPNLVPAEWTKAAYDALARRRFGPLARSLNDKTILEIAGEATAVLGALWPMIVAEDAARIVRADLAACGFEWVGCYAADLHYSCVEPKGHEGIHRGVPVDSTEEAQK